MPRKPKPIDLGVVRALALAMPGVEETLHWGTAAWKVKGKMFACVPTNKAAEPDSLAVRISFERRDEMVEQAPEKYYAPEHYRSYSTVLVRLARVGEDELRDLLGLSYRFVSAAKAAKPRAAKRAKSPA